MGARLEEGEEEEEGAGLAAGVSPTPGEPQLQMGVD